jgi:hypothetical protein
MPRLPVVHHTAWPALKAMFEAVDVLEAGGYLLSTRYS